MRLSPSVLILDEPTQGVDIGAKTEIYKLVERAATDGLSVLMIDSDFEDLCRLCDRVLVLKNGEAIADLRGSDKSRKRILEIIYRRGAHV
jgi:ABC-type sugar transport system ATPase subunit